MDFVDKQKTKQEFNELEKYTKYTRLECRYIETIAFQHLMLIMTTYQSLTVIASESPPSEMKI